MYQTSERTVTNWINALKDNGHVTVSFTYVSGKKEIESRILKLTEAKTAKKAQNDETDNKQPNPSQEVVKISSEGGEKICRDNTTSINTTTTSASDPPNTRPPPDEAAAVPLSPPELKKALAAIDPLLILSVDFYPRAAAFMAANGLDRPYLSWMYEQCKRQKPRSLRGLYYTLFFDDAQPEIYKASIRPAATPPPPPDMPCPVCGTLHAQRDDACPSCGLPKNAPADRIRLLQQLHEFPPEKRDEYLRREQEIDKVCDLKDYVKYSSLYADLQREFGLETA